MSSYQPQPFSDFCGRFRINFAAGQGRKPVSNEDHGVTSLALCLVNPKGKITVLGLNSQFGNETISLVHIALCFDISNIGYFYPNIKQIRIFLSESELLPCKFPDVGRNGS